MTIGTIIYQTTIFWFLVNLLIGTGDAFAQIASQGSQEKISSVVFQAQSDRIAAIQSVVPGTVMVFDSKGAGGGSGVLITADGYALTNFHVVGSSNGFLRCGLADGKLYHAVIVGIDPVGDLAMIRLLGRDDFPAVPIGDSAPVRAGDWCFVVGNPFLLANNLQPTVTWGIVSGVARYQYPAGTLLEYANCLQVDASINPGNSGGPLFDAKGRLIGIIGRGSFEKRGRVNVGVGYAISIDQAKNFLGHLHSGRILDHANLGATVSTDSEEGVRVSNILESSDAYRRGLRYGDEILEIDGHPVNTANEVQNILGTLPSQWRVTLAYRQDGKTVNTLVRLGAGHGKSELLKKMAAWNPVRPRRSPDPEKSPKAPDGKPHPNPEKDKGSPNGKPGFPKTVERLFERQTGYANYYMNRQAQKRVWRSICNSIPMQDSATSQWSIRGTIDGNPGKQVEIVVGRDLLEMTIADDTETKTLQLQRGSDKYRAISSQAIAACLVNLESLHRMVQRGRQEFGETYYLGTMPLLGKRPLRDVLVGTDIDVETRFFVHPQSKRLEAIEAFATSDVDPAELLFTWPKATSSDRQQGISVPVSLELSFGTESAFKMNIQSWRSKQTSD